MQSRKDYSQIIKHEKFLSDDLKKLDNIIEKYEKEHTLISGFPDDDLVKLGRESAKFTSQQFPDFAGSTGSFIKNINVAFMFFNEPNTIGNPVSIITQEINRKIQLDQLPNSINFLIKNIELFQGKITDNSTQELCKSILHKLHSFEAEVISFKVESNKTEESKNIESNSTNIQGQKKTVIRDFQDQQKFSLSANSSSTMFPKVNITDSEDNINNNKPKKPEEEQEHKETTPPKSPVGSNKNQ